MAGDLVRLFLGTSPARAEDGAVWSVDLDPATGRLGEPVLRARTPAPSFLALTPDGRALFAAGETAPGAVTRFAVGPGGDLAPRERVSSGGSGPCHLLLHPAGHALYAANYGSGSVAVVPLRPGDDGALELVGGVAQVFEHSGRGPVPGRQEGPHVHATTLTPDGAALLAADLGTDEVRVYRLRPDGLVDADGAALHLPPGTGPRHLAWGPGGHLYLVGELAVDLHVLAWDGRALHHVAAVPLGHPAGPDEVLAAHVVADGGRVLVSVRGPDEVVTLVTRDGGARPERSASLAAGAAWPRHFAVVGDWLVVCGQRDDRVVVLPREGGDVAGEAHVPAPTCVVAASRA